MGLTVLALSVVEMLTTGFLGDTALRMPALLKSRLSSI